MNLIIGLLIPFLGTVLGSTMVFFMKDKINKKIEKLLLGFASGVMIAASVWSLMIPAINMSEYLGKLSWIPTSIGFTLGVLFLLLLEFLIPLFKIDKAGNNHEKNKFKKTIMMLLAITIHNIPEGMAVGVTFAGALIGNTGVTLAGAFVLAMGIAIQNFPEGAIISMPLKNQGISRSKAFLCGSLSGIVEPIAAASTIMITNLVVPILPYILSFAAGTMMYVVVEELIPESQQGEYAKIGVIGLSIGFVIMMILDLALG